MSPDLQKADRAMIDARCNTVLFKTDYMMEAVDAIIDHLMKQEKHVEEASQDAPRTPSFGVWRDIATAPRDDGYVLLFWYEWPSSKPALARWSEHTATWVNGVSEYFAPTHWTPLPPPPTA